MPILCVWLLKHNMGHEEENAGAVRPVLRVYGTTVTWFVRLALGGGAGYLGACALVLWHLVCNSAPELFPQVDSGEFVLRFRPPPGSNFEIDPANGGQVPEEIEKEAKPGEHRDLNGLCGPIAPNFGIDNMVLFMRGPDDGQCASPCVKTAGSSSHASANASQGTARAGASLADRPAGTGRAIHGKMRRESRHFRPLGSSRATS